MRYLMAIWCMDLIGTPFQRVVNLTCLHNVIEQAYLLCFVGPKDRLDWCWNITPKVHKS